jgi:hypothetical protein
MSTMNLQNVGGNVNFEHLYKKQYKIWVVGYFAKNNNISNSMSTIDLQNMGGSMFFILINSTSKDELLCEFFNFLRRT